MIPFHPLADIFPLIVGAEFAALVQGMRDHGYRNGEEIVLFEGMILDGRNRYRAAIAAGIITADDVPHVGDASWIFCEFTSEGGEGLFSEEEIAAGPLAFVISKNVHRRHLDESQRAMVAARIETLKHGQRKDIAAAEAGPDSKPRTGRDANLHVSRAEAAALLNVSPRTVAHAAVVRDQAEPELRLAVDQGHLKVSAAAKAVVMPADRQRAIADDATAGKANVVNAEIKKAARNLREAELGAKQVALPDRKFGVVLEDPEWDTIVWSRDTGMDRHQANQYPVSSDAALAARDVASIMADHCVHLVWCKDLMQGLRLIQARGTVLKSYIVWVKDIVEVDLTPEQRRAGNDADRHFVEIGTVGTGFWVRDRDELLLIAVKGSPVCPAPGTQGESVVFAARPRDAGGKIIHSAKPECILEWVEKHWPSTPKIELNARRARAGWVQWGNEAPAAEVIQPLPEAPSDPSPQPSPSGGEGDRSAAPAGGPKAAPSSAPTEGMPSGDRVAAALANIRSMVA